MTELEHKKDSSVLTSMCPIFSYFDGEHHRAEPAQYINRRLTEIEARYPAGNKSAEVLCAITAEAFGVKESKLTTVGLMDLYSQWRRFIVYSCQEYGVRDSNDVPPAGQKFRDDLLKLMETFASFVNDNNLCEVIPSHV
jgi:hypothetical protein